MATGRNKSGDGEHKNSVKRTEVRNKTAGWSPGRRQVLPEGMNTGKAGKDPAKPKIRKPIGM